MSTEIQLIEILKSGGGVGCAFAGAALFAKYATPFLSTMMRRNDGDPASKSTTDQFTTAAVAIQEVKSIVVGIQATLADMNKRCHDHSIRISRNESFLERLDERTGDR